MGALQLLVVRRKKLLNKEIGLREKREREEMALGNSRMVQWLGLRAFTAEGLDLIPSQGMESHRPCSRAKKRKERELLLSVHKSQKMVKLERV